jgi:hypothetical protein
VGHYDGHMDKTMDKTGITAWIEEKAAKGEL